MDFSAWLASINWMTALGWFVAPIISLKINQVIKEQVKIVTYSVAASNFFSDDSANRVGQSLGSKIQILIDGKLANHVTYVTVTFQNTANKKLKNIKINFNFGEDAYLYKYQIGIIKNVYYGDIKEVQRWVNAVTIDVSFLDKNQIFSMSFLLINHHPDNVFVEGKCEDDEIRVISNAEAEKTFKGFSTSKLILLTLALVILINSLTPHVSTFIEGLTQNTSQ